MKILLLGKNGQVGSELMQPLAGLGELSALGRHDLDLSDQQAIRRTLHELQPQVIVNAAAYTAVDRAETEQDMAMAINGVAPGIMAEEAQRLGALLVHYSTDYVFNGAKRAPYVEQDETDPLNAYGRSKLAGELAIAAKSSRFLIFRTSWIYDRHGRNFLNTIRRAAKQRSELGIVDDQIGAPTWSRDIARATAQAISLFLALKDREKASGIYHLTAQGQTSWFGFAQVAMECGLFADMQAPLLRAISTAEYPTPAKRPLYSVLSNIKLKEQFGIRLPDWRLSLRGCMQGMNEVK